MNPDSEIGTADSTDFTDFEEVIRDDRTNRFAAKLQGVANRNLLYLCNLRNLWLIKSVSVFGLNKRDARLVPQRNSGSRSKEILR